ncbi:MAG: phosphate ABC transporter substrate-binding/OmpA family protein, partial [Gammaproteobacteria bacterium]|nr:phosphate ABC transporter substrate-binding/OmpA family protein [Gammaproteobacteria bacterium]
IVVLSVFTSQAWSAEQLLLRLHGSNTIGAELAPALIQRWLAHRGYTGITQQRLAAEEVMINALSMQGERVGVLIKAHGSSTSFKALAASEADIGMSSRPIKEKEVTKLAHLGRMDAPGSEFVLGLDGIAVIVHPDNPLSHLDKETLRQIFAGELQDWRQLGGVPGPIQIYARDDKSGTYDTFKSLVLGKRSPLVQSAQRFESNARLSDAVAADRNGIGFVGLPYIRQSKALAVMDGGQTAILPDGFTVATEDYALARRLFLYLPESTGNQVARDFIEFAISSDGQQVVAETGFVSQEIITGTAVASGMMHEEYRVLTEGAKRLSLNFRFHRGSSQLDNKARTDVRRLIDFITRAGGDKSELILVGFSDKHESIPMHSLALSIHRADRVADVLISNGLAPNRVRGFGPAVTVAANDTPQGREKNRRVEVWLR